MLADGADYGGCVPINDRGRGVLNNGGYPFAAPRSNPDEGLVQILCGTLYLTVYPLAVARVDASHQQDDVAEGHLDPNGLIQRVNVRRVVNRVVPRDGVVAVEEVGHGIQQVYETFVGVPVGPGVADEQVVDLCHRSVL